MNLDDLKVIWESQSDKPLYAINEEALQSMLRQSTERFTRSMRWQRLLTYGGTLAVIAPIALLLIAHFGGFVELATGWDVLALIVAATAWLQFAGKMFVGRGRQERSERHFTSSLRDELDRDIAQVAYQIDGRNRIMLGFVPPSVGALLLTWVAFRMMGITSWAIVPLVAALLVNLVLETRSQQRLVDRELVPRRRELETLRAKLSAPRLTMPSASSNNAAMDRR